MAEPPEDEAPVADSMSARLAESGGQAAAVSATPDLDSIANAQWEALGVPPAARRWRLGRSSRGVVLGAVAVFVALLGVVAIALGGSGGKAEGRPEVGLVGGMVGSQSKSGDGSSSSAGPTGPGSPAPGGSGGSSATGGSEGSSGAVASPTTVPGARFATVDAAVAAGVLDQQVVDEVKASGVSNALVVVDRVPALTQSTARGVAPNSPEANARYVAALQPIKQEVIALGVPLIRDFPNLAIMYFQFQTIDQILLVANHPKVARIAANSVSDLTG